MILQNGNVAELVGVPWLCLEIFSTNATERTIHRLGKKIPGIMGAEAIEVFVPIVKRGETVELAHSDLIYARAKNRRTIFRLRKEVTGLAGVLCRTENQAVNGAIEIPDADIQKLIAHCEAQRAKESEGIAPGSFVRVLDGTLKMFCGFVESIAPEGTGAQIMAVVRINYISKFIYVTTPVRNLENLDHVKPSRRVYFFSDLVEKMEDDSLIAEYLEVEEEKEPVEDLSLPALPRTEPRLIKHRGSLVGLIRDLIAAGELDPRTIAKAIISGMLDGTVDKTKNTYQIFCAVKIKVIPAMGVKNWRAVEKRVGYKFKAFNLHFIALKMGLDVPFETPVEKRTKYTRAAVK
jgi:transcription antitermination factor NusG